MFFKEYSNLKKTFGIWVFTLILFWYIQFTKRILNIIISKNRYLYTIDINKHTCCISFINLLQIPIIIN